MPAEPASTFSSQRSIGLFLAKVLAVYVVWYVVYDLWLLPDGSLDRWLSLNVAGMSGSLLSLFGFDAVAQGRNVLMSGVPGVRVVNGCNGLTTIGLFIGFVVAYPGAWARRVGFVVFGIGVIYVTNVLRVAGMVAVQKYAPSLFDPLHGFGMTTIFYVVVFALWVVWANWGNSTRPRTNLSPAPQPSG